MSSAISTNIFKNDLYWIEKIDNTYKYLIEMFNLSCISIPHIQKIPGKPSYVEFYDDKLKGIVGNLFKEYIEMWNYNFQNK